MERHNYANGTYFTVRDGSRRGRQAWGQLLLPWAVFHGGRAMCSDGKVRAIHRIAQTADTFFSVPGAVKVNGKTVSGYFTVECVSGSSVETDNDPAMVKFVAVRRGKNWLSLPTGTWRVES